MNEARIEQIRQRLQALEPSALDILDESAQHRGHAGARDGRGHFRVRIASRRFDGLKPLARHRLVYEAVGEMMQTDIHALAIEAKGSEDT
jgi:BolA protein